MACECGWSHEYIAENFTLAQISKYYELIQRKKLRELRLQGIVMAYAHGFGAGNLDKDKFCEFVDAMDDRVKQYVDPIAKMKEAGIPVEET